MTFLTGADIIDSALTIIKNNSTPIRTKMLTWLNVMAAKLLAERRWSFLDNGSYSVTPTSNVITAPFDYGSLIALSCADFVLKPQHRLTATEAWTCSDPIEGTSAPAGFTEGIATATVFGAPNTNVAGLRVYLFDSLGIEMTADSSITLPDEYEATTNGTVDVEITVPTDATYQMVIQTTAPTLHKNQLVVAMPPAYSATYAAGVFRITNATELTLPGSGSSTQYIVISFLYDYGTTTINRNRTITLHGATITTPVTLTYSIEPTDFADTANETAWPKQCLPLFQRGLLDGFYEYDMDERAANSYQLNAIELARLKKWDNLFRPKGQVDIHGYTRRK